MLPEDKDKKKHWVNIGIKAEEEFIKNSKELFGLDTCINPERTANKYAADLLLPHGRIGDLKTVRTPFFLASKYGHNPSTTVTFNHKDYIRYLYKNFVRRDYFYVLFWCNWGGDTRYGVTVGGINGLWCIDIHGIDHLITTGKSKCHQYQMRKDMRIHEGNSSWILSLNDRKEIVNGEPSILSSPQSHSESVPASQSPVF